MRLEFDYSLTLFRASSSFAVPAFHGDLRTPGLGICETEINGTGTAVKLRCRQAGNSIKCRPAFLEDAATGMVSSWYGSLRSLGFASAFGRADGRFAAFAAAGFSWGSPPLD